MYYTRVMAKGTLQYVHVHVYCLRFRWFHCFDEILLDQIFGIFFFVSLNFDFNKFFRKWIFIQICVYNADNLLPPTEIHVGPHFHSEILLNFAENSQGTRNDTVQSVYCISLNYKPHT